MAGYHLCSLSFFGAVWLSALLPHLTERSVARGVSCFPTCRTNLHQDRLPTHTRARLSLSIETTNCRATRHRRRIGDRGDTLPCFSSTRALVSEISKVVVSSSSPVFAKKRNTGVFLIDLLVFVCCSNMFFVRSPREQSSPTSGQSSNAVRQGLIGALGGSDTFRTQLALG